MPIHLDDLDVSSQLADTKSALIVPCNMCPAVTLAVKKDKPLIRLFNSFLKLGPFEEHIEELRSRLEEQGVSTSVFHSPAPHHWFMCMWPSRKRSKLRERARQYDAVVVLGCDTATETVREAVEPTGCRVIEGMRVTGFMNARLRLRRPCDVCFEGCRLVTISTPSKEGDEPAPSDRLRRVNRESAHRPS